MKLATALARGRLSLWVQRYPQTGRVNVTVAPLATLAIINFVAVADGKFGLGAKSPDCVLHVSRKISWKLRIESRAVYAPRQTGDDVRAAVRAIAHGAILMTAPQTTQNSCSPKPIMDECVNGDHRGTSTSPPLAAWICDQQKPRQRHC